MARLFVVGVLGDPAWTFVCCWVAADRLQVAWNMCVVFLRLFLRLASGIWLALQRLDGFEQHSSI